MHSSTFRGRKILITAGPTREAIDPVRYISNHSSGKMGYALAQEFLDQGAEVVLVSGPVCLSLVHPRLRIEKVNTATEMYLAGCRYFETTDIAVFAAAVADYRPAKTEEQKIKKEGTEFMIRMTKNVDIAFEFGIVKQSGQLSVGFALETNDEMAHAEVKLRKKNFDMVILNSMNDNQATFGHDTNKITVLKTGLPAVSYPLKHKQQVAKDILKEIQLLQQQEMAEAANLEQYEKMYW